MASVPQVSSVPDGLPASVHTEIAVLGAMLLDEKAVVDAVSKLTHWDFAIERHQRIFRCMYELFEIGTPFDINIVRAELERKRELKSIGGPAYLFYLTEGIPRNFSIESYVQIVKDKSLLRQGMTLCYDAAVRCKDQSNDAVDVLSRLQAEISELLGRVNSANIETPETITPRVVAKIIEERSSPNRDDAMGYSYDIPELDKFTKGAYPNEYTIIAAETGGAKTAWATQITLKNAMKKIPCLWFSMEMTKEQLIRRMISSLATVVTAKDIRDPRWMHEAEFQDMLKTSNILERFPIHIDDSRQLPLDVLIARAKAAMYRDGVKLIIVDYIQIVRSMTKARNQNDTERIEATTLALRDLAAESKAFGVHVIGLSQYSRPADGGKAKAENRRAKGSSSLEQSCQAMFHIVRDMLEDGSLSTDVEIVVGKQREGRFGRIKCIFDENHLRFKTTTLI